MSDRKWVDVPIVIRNLHQRRWPLWVLRGGILGAGLACFCAIKTIPHPIYYFFTLAAVLFLAAAFGLAFGILVSRPIRKIVLGDRLEIWPGHRRYPLPDIQQIELISSPEEDYRESTDGPAMQQVRVTIRSIYRAFSVTAHLSATDVEKLTRWANKHEIRLLGAGAPH